MTFFVFTLPFAAVSSPVLGNGSAMIGEQLYVLESAIRLCLSDSNGQKRYQELMVEWIELINKIKRDPSLLDRDIAKIEQSLSDRAKAGTKIEQLRPDIAVLARIQELRATLFSEPTKPVEEMKPESEEKVDPSLQPFLGTYSTSRGFATLFFDGWNLMLWEGPTPSSPLSLTLDQLNQKTTRPGYTFFDNTIEIESRIEKNTLFKTTTTTTWTGKKTVEEQKLIKNGALLILSTETRVLKRNLLTRRWSEISKQIWFQEFKQTSVQAMTFEEFQRAIQDRPQIYKYIGGLGKPLSGANLAEAIRAGLLVPVYDSPSRSSTNHDCEEDLE